MIDLRVMAASEIERIGEVDRSEHVTREYVHRDGRLVGRAVDVRIPRWSAEGEGDTSVPGNVAIWRPFLDEGGRLIGAFDGGALVGFAIHRAEIAPGTANLAALYVSRPHRGLGIGARLAAEVIRLAREGGARRLYVSATPSQPTVDFYRSHGFVLAPEPDPVLFAREPLDIHLVLELDA